MKPKEEIRYFVKVAGKNGKSVFGLKEALKTAQADLLRYNLRHSYATIYYEPEDGSRYKIPAYQVMIGGDYAKPKDAIQHGYPFILQHHGDRGWVGRVKLKLDGSW